MIFKFHLELIRMCQIIIEIDYLIINSGDIISLLFDLQMLLSYLLANLSLIVF
jgi:hypothetical protein